MADNFLRRLFGRSSNKTPVPLAGVRPRLERQPLQPPGVAGGSPGAGGPEMRVDIGTLSDVGCVREVNEDCIRVIRPTDPNELARRGLLVVVADGMGGHNAGEIASRLAVEVVVQRYADETLDPGKALAQSMEQANRIIVAAAAKDARYSGMGTTCTALLLRDGLAYCAHVGDSRLYLVRGNDILLMTEDHSAVMDMVKRGAITAEEARHHPDKNVIVRALGGRADVEVATWEKPLSVRPGDTFLICSDGLYDVVEDNELFDAMRGPSPQLACERLVELARQRGGPDNITVGIISVTE
ncbi:MAG TPA: Stp1/IreP family PP2C-type Ser/Thr phosphatase [Gemmatimonadaceae bacterium]|nr:Stp1/IreP family PP2C-type Ser/Thr phosphatase [Gemmatimonadaceae bacterium]